MRVSRRTGPFSSKKGSSIISPTMRKASAILFSNLPKSLLSPRSLTTHLLLSDLPSKTPSPRPPPLFHPRLGRLTPSPKIIQCRVIQTLPSTPCPLPPHHPELESLQSATTTEGILTAFDALESSVCDDDPKLRTACLMAAQHLDSTGGDDLEKALTLGLRALKISERLDGAGSLSVAKALRLVGSVARKLRRFDDSLDTLTTAEQILDSLELDGFLQPEIRSIGADVQTELAATKTMMGRRRDALLNLRRSVELKTRIFAPDSLELAAGYKDLAEAYTVVLDFEEALPLVLKALKIHEDRAGQDSMEEVHIRQLLGIVYVGLGKNEEAMEQNELLRTILHCLDLEDELFQVEIEAANIQIALGRPEEAINSLKGAIQKTKQESEARALVFVSMAKALAVQEKFGDSKRCLEMSCSILDKTETASPVKAAEAYAEISMLYEAMTEFETALSLMRRTLAILEKHPQEGHLEGSISARIGWLLLLTGRVPQAVPYLESAIQRLKESFGPKHFGVGFAYKHLGQAYFEMDQLQSAVQMLTLAKDIICALFGPHHEDSIDTYQCLANAYGAIGNYVLALEFQQQVVDAWENHGPSGIDEFREAHRLLEQLRRKAQGSPSAVFPANTLPLPSQK